VSWQSGPMHGTGSLGRRGQRCCIRSGRFVPGRATRSPCRATCCSTFAPSDWIYASSWRRRSWHILVTPFGRRRGAGIPVLRRRDLLGFVDGTENPRGEAVMDAVLIGEEDPGSPAAVTSSCRNTFTTLTDGMHCPQRRRNESSAARSWRTLNWMTL